MSVDDVVVRISRRSREVLGDCARKENLSLKVMLERIIEDYRTRKFFGDFDRAYAADNGDLDEY